MQNLTPEQEIIFLLSRLNPSADVLEKARGLLGDAGHPVDYGSLVRLASANEVTPLLYTNLAGMDNVPGDVKEKLRNSYLGTVKNNVRNEHEMLGILDMLKNEGVEAIPLKGALASGMIFGNPGLYPAADIDILVRPSGLERAGEILKGAGYSKSEGYDERDLLISHYHFLYQRDRHNVEVHWNLVKRYFDIPPDFWWGGIRKAGHEGRELSMLQTERYIMYTVFRLFDHGFRPLKFFVLVSEIVNKYRDEIDWRGFRSFSRQYGMSRLCNFTLRLLNDMLGTKVPENVAGSRVFGYGAFKRLVVSGLFKEAGRPHLRMFLYTFLLDSPLDLARVILRRFFPRAGEIRLRYNLPKSSKKLYAYYLLNPFLVLLKKSPRH